MSERTANGELRRAIARFARRWHRAAQAAPPPDTLAAMGAAEFRAAVAERLRGLERDVAEVRSRVNGLLFMVAGAAVTQVVLRLLG